jgi:hypothetical protein
VPRPEPICARTLQPGSAGMVRRSRRYATQQTAVQIPRGAGESDLPMKTKTHFAFRIDTWDDDWQQCRRAARRPRRSRHSGRRRCGHCAAHRQDHAAPGRACGAEELGWMNRAPGLNTGIPRATISPPGQRGRFLPSPSGPPTGPFGAAATSPTAGGGRARPLGFPASFRVAPMWRQPIKRQLWPDPAFAE